MEQEKEKNEETFVKKVVQTALEAERQIRRQQVLHNTRMLMEEYIEMKRHIESAVSEEDELKEEQYDVFRGEGAHLGSVRRSKMKTAMMIANIDRAMEELRAEYEMKEMVYISDPNADREILDEGYVHGYHYCIVSLGSHPCAYVEIPKDHPCYGLNYEKIKVSCHGGLTYSEKGIGPLFPDAFWIGWDYMHFGDRIEMPSYGARGKTWTTREILTEVENVVYQLSRIGGKGG